MTNFHSGINLGLPLAIYTRKQEKCQVFAANARVPIALAFGNMMLAWHT
jgi:hypothetical protein